MAASNKATPGITVEERDTWEERYAQSGFFNISSTAKKKIDEKRRRKGLGEVHAREKSVYGQLFVYGTTLTLVKTIGAPLERMRIILQTRHMQNLKANERPSGSTMELFNKISKEQGTSQFWRGNNANIYKTLIQLSLRVFFYDKVKLYFMPYDNHKYSGFDFFWRSALAFSICTAMTTLVVYPFDTIHTRIACDLTQKG